MHTLIKVADISFPKMNKLLNISKQTELRSLSKKDSLADAIVLPWNAWSEMCWRNREWSPTTWRDLTQPETKLVFPETWNEAMMFLSHLVSPTLLLTASFSLLVWRKRKCTGNHMEPTFTQTFSAHLGLLSA